MGDSSLQTAPTWVLPTGCSSSQTPPAWVLPTGRSPSGTGCSRVGPHGVTSLDSKPAPARAPQGITSSFRHPSTCSGVGSLPRATGGSLLHRGLPWAAGAQPASPWSSLQAAGESLLRHFRHLLLLHWPWCLQGCFTLSHSSLLLEKCHYAAFFSPFLNYVIPGVLPPSLTGLALASSLGAGWHWLCWTWGKLLPPSHRSPPPLPKPCHANLVQGYLSIKI